MPVPVKGAQAIEHNGLIYVLGGYSDSTYAATNLIQVYNPMDNTWQILSDTLKIPRYGFSADNYRNSIVMFGSEFAPDSTLEMWDFLGPTYFYDAKKIFARQFATCQVLGNYLYIFGGLPGLNHDGQPYMVEYYIPESRVTFTLASSSSEYPQPLETDIIQQTSAVVGNKIYLFGGALNGILNDIYIFNTDDSTFSKLNVKLRTARASAAAVSVDNSKIIVIGGYNESNPALFSTEFYEAEPLNQFSFIGELGNLNIARSELTAVPFQDSLIFVFGGQDVLGQCVPEVEKMRFWFDATAISTKNKKPETFLLMQNFPNPFNQQTVIRFSITLNETVDLSVFDITGRKVKTIVHKRMPSGFYRFQWDGTDDSGKQLASGVYFYRLKNGHQQQIRRLILLR